MLTALLTSAELGLAQGWGFLAFSQKAEEQEQTLLRERPKSREQRAEATQQGVK